MVCFVFYPGAASAQLSTRCPRHASEFVCLSSGGSKALRGRAPPTLPRPHPSRHGAKVRISAAKADAEVRPPGSVGRTVKDMKEAIQAALSSRLSRVDIQLPPGTSFGLEANASGAALYASESLSSEERSSRECARLVLEMFAGTELNTAVIFNDASATTAARAMWLEHGDATLLDAKALAKRSKSPEKPLDVMICVAPRIRALMQIKSASEEAGDRMAVILINARLESIRWPNAPLAEFFLGGFENVLLYDVLEDDGSGKLSLYRKFPAKFTLCRKEGLGAPKVVHSWDRRPEAAELQTVVRNLPAPAKGLFSGLPKLF
ncbi:hypothetical protein FVE85_0218 [Porphyridium purpureum]|uniref:DUF1995 domain-containing protein n=1 Tax=Porphyridium purpureum TaxID=35688 RepID=A0A5J4YY14_PORPP|nr:hypothetical protein FVE85_0218 [Porphyridium purpureum]|eukprot:POR7579..scf208_2